MNIFTIGRILTETMNMMPRAKGDREPEIHYEIYKQGFSDAKLEFATVLGRYVDGMSDEEIHPHIVLLEEEPSENVTLKDEDPTVANLFNECHRLSQELDKERTRSENLMKQNQDLITRIEMAKRIL